MSIVAGRICVSAMGEGAMLLFSVRAALVAGLALSMTTAGLYAQNPKPKAKPQAAGQMFCNAQGCRPVAPGCRLEQPKNSHGNSAPIEVCK